MKVEEYRTALYDPELQVQRAYNKLQFVQAAGTICNILTKKRALNASYCKLYSEDLVQCKSWD